MGKVSAQNTDIGLPSDPSRVEPYGAHSAAVRMKLSVLDLLPTVTMEAGSFYYTVEGGNLDSTAGDGPAETAEGSIKPSSDLTLTDAQCVAVTIAHYQKLKRQQLDDVAGLAVGVQARMTYQVLRRLEHEIIAGDGQGANMTGILSMTGVASVPYVASTPFADLVMLGIDAVIQSEAVPNGVIMNPSDWSAALVAKATGSGE